VSKVKSFWQCSECGHQQSRWTGSCSMCHQWNTFSEMQSVEESKPKFVSQKPSSKPLRISEINISSFSRKSTKMKEVDRLFGGGIVSGSLILLGGDPGIGKSTLLLQLAHFLAEQNEKVLYVCAEESIEQTSLRANRLNLGQDNLYLFNETSFTHIKQEIDKIKPTVLIVDSVQVVYKTELPSSPGSVVQVREIASECMHIAKGYGVTTFLIGHVTKSGEIAGPRVLEHLVDTVLEFEGDRHHGYRLLRSVKNRFGPTDDIAIFQMHEKGLKEISNPSEIFLEHRKENVSGCVATATVEGLRPFLIEVQALVTTSAYSTATRKTTGLDQNRLALLIAVLEKRVGYLLHQCDVFVSVAGGMKIKEPSIDLAVLLAIASSFTNRSIDTNTIVMGEVGLAGEVRAIPRIESRIKEAVHMGFKKCILPKKNQKELDKALASKIELVPVDLVDEAIQEILP